ncbi:hypothetical protein OHT57_30985 [Streptomyces sp. NBC_00285]|uniref:hypothetical protein n=1 Tax=Streptomyces sp. NBC_00285 TaxID=2975700 RepID=UPI002E28BC3F|nr:hypothetical protein [Streptomyces sp. NBC_00285]
MLVVSPESGETASLYYSDKEFGELQRLLDIPGAGTWAKPPEATLAAARQINVTWMLHDVSPWRMDQVFPLPDTDHVWIRTNNLPESVNSHWYQPKDAARIRALLDDLGVMGKVYGGGGAVFPTSGQESGSGAGAVHTEAAKTSARLGPSATAGDGAGWWWALPGLAAGAVLALALRPFALRRPWGRLHQEPGPRQELRDV